MCATRNEGNRVSLDDLITRALARRQLPAPAERRKIREDAGVSQRELARALGVSYTAVHLWEKGTKPRGAAATAYARALEELRRVAA